MLYWSIVDPVRTDNREIGHGRDRLCVLTRSTQITPFNNRTSLQNRLVRLINNFTFDVWHTRMSVLSSYRTPTQHFCTLTVVNLKACSHVSVVNSLVKHYWATSGYLTRWNILHTYHKLIFYSKLMRTASKINDDPLATCSSECPWCGYPLHQES